MKSYVNLIPTGTIIRLRIAQRVRQWLTVLACTLTVVLVGTVIQWKRLESSGVELNRLESAADPLRKLEREIATMRQRLEHWNTRASLAAHLVDQRTMLSLFALVSRAAEEAEGAVCVHRFSVQPAAASTRRDFSGDDGFALRQLQLDGWGLDDSSVARFMAALRHSQAFHDVQLKSTEAAQQEEPKIRAYQMECVF